MKSNLNKLYLTAVMLFISLVSVAQVDPPADPDAPPAPINTQLIWLALAITVFVFFYINNKKSVIK